MSIYFIVKYMVGVNFFNGLGFDSLALTIKDTMWPLRAYRPKIPVRRITIISLTTRIPFLKWHPRLTLRSHIFSPKMYKSPGIPHF